MLADLETIIIGPAIDGSLSKRTQAERVAAAVGSSSGLSGTFTVSRPSKFQAQPAPGTAS